jgi:hypothetical protein
MAHCNFKFPIPDISDESLATVKKTMQKYKGIFEGNTSAGHFRIPIGIGEIHGDYTVEDEIMYINITKKPIVVSCKVIEQQIKKFMNPAE